MYKHIVVPLDGSKRAEQILPTVKSLAQATQAQMHLIGVINIDDFDAKADRTRQQYLDVMCTQAMSAVRTYLEEVAGRLKLPVERVRVEARIGKTVDTILEMAESQQDAVIALSTHGRSGLARLAFGSVADAVLHAARVPVLVFHPAEEVESPVSRHWANLIVPLDGSALSEQVLPEVQALAKELKLSVRLVMVTPGTMDEVLGYAGLGLPYVPQDVLGNTDVWVAQYLDLQVAALTRAGVSATPVHLKGDAGSRLVEYIKATPDSLVAIATHGRSGVRRAVLGSVANKIVRQAGVPTLVIRSQ